MTTLSAHPALALLLLVPAPAKPPVVVGVRPDAGLTGAWHRFGDAGGGRADRRGWAAGDGTYSVPLPDGRVAWLFGDTFLGPVDADGGLPRDAPFLHNSMVVTGPDGRPGTTAARGTPAAPRSLLGATPTAPPWNPSGTNPRWYWPGDGIVDGGRLRVFAYTIAPADAAPPWNFRWVRNGLVTFGRGLRPGRVRRTYGDGGVMWGVELLRAGGYVYVYGSEAGHMHLARAHNGHLAERSWEFYTGSGWSRDPKASARIADNVGASYSVTRVGGRYVLTTTDAYLGHDVYAATASTPTGPFTGRTAVYTAPEGRGTIYAPYNVAAHPELSRPGELVISYNVNSEKLDDLYADADNNRARFLVLRFAR
ncbi:DUF5005 domain-containing protein [Actinomadura atramentaria]|uniref:DUF5005 domain-containing protein n=1 Tax=Actinomadura atramentaria TaxID=1990 RepID=UPI00146C8620|nr:DUF5005 domain-containing protein [Actinomadura atramentaria]